MTYTSAAPAIWLWAEASLTPIFDCDRRDSYDEIRTIAGPGHRRCIGVNPHLHAIVTDGFFSDNGIFHVTPGVKPHDLEDLFRYGVFKMLRAEGKITDAVIESMLSWHHSGFNVYCGSAIWPHDESALENLAHHVIRAAFSQERMSYVTDDQSADGIAEVTYQSEDGRTSKTFGALDWLAQLTTHIPGKNEQMVR